MMMKMMSMMKTQIYFFLRRLDDADASVFHDNFGMIVVHDLLFVVYVMMMIMKKMIPVLDVFFFVVAVGS